MKRGKQISLLLPAVLLTAVSFAPIISACGPFFPNMLLENAAESAATAPQASFELELSRMSLIPAPHKAKPGGVPSQTLEVELAELRAALSKMGLADAQREAIVARHLIERQKIAPFDTEESRANSTNSWQFHHPWLLRPSSNDPPRIAGAPPQITPGLPPEFADYFRGAVAWHENKIEDARAAWMGLLKRPSQERLFKSTWAAFMIGKSWEETNHVRAIHFFQEVRRMATNGLADSLGLAASSLGYEARMHWREGRLAQAFDLYLEQVATGDDTAPISLQVCSYAALQRGSSALRLLAVHPRAQRVVTAYVIAGGWEERPIDVDGAAKERLIKLLEATQARLKFVPVPTHHLERPVMLWLEAVEKAGVKDVASAERLALAAYQAGEFGLCQRWLARASNAPVAFWLRAKLLLRAGDVNGAAAILARLAQLFPVEAAPDIRTNAPLLGNLYVDQIEHEDIPGPRQLLGELGLCRLARREYVEALDALLRAKFWADAAYVAERVLTLDELKTYVDRHWASVPAVSLPPPEKRESASGIFAPLPGEELNSSGRPRWSHTDLLYSDEVSPAPHEYPVLIRYLLGRRLARAHRWAEARPYFPKQWLGKFEELVRALNNAQNPRLAKPQRAQAFLTAAKLTREEGIELIGTEVEPDWRMHGGNFQEGPSVADRLPGTNLLYLGASPDELQRAQAHRPEPNLRYHYRHTAAMLAWEAAQLMPDSSPERSKALSLGRSWLQSIGSPEADKFYKALVRRPRKTEVGAAADRSNRQPELDQKGKAIPRAKSPPSPP
jgi:hypothetical protein